MSERPTAQAATKAAFWRDVLDWARDGYAVLYSDDSRTTIRARGSDIKEVLAFGPDEWATFVLEGDWFAGPRDPAVYDPRLSGYAVDELSETLGSKGSPLVIRDGRLVRE